MLPKDKKAKEEKTSLLGQCTVDLLPLLTGETKLSVTATLTPPGGVGSEGEQPAEVDINVTASKPVLSAEDVAQRFV